MQTTVEAQPEQTMSERCVTITLKRYNELIEAEEKLNQLKEYSSLRMGCTQNPNSFKQNEHN